MYTRLPQTHRTRQERFQFSHISHRRLISSTPTVLNRLTPWLVRHTGTALHDITPTIVPQPWWYNTTKVPEDMNDILQAIQSGTAEAICDGSFKEGLGTAAIVILPNIASNDPLVIQIQTPGPANTMNSYRAELSGIYTIIQTVNRLCDQAHITYGKVKIGCDCSAGLMTVFGHKRIQPNTPHSDILQAIRKGIQNSPITWERIHIKAHQDDTKTWQELTPHEQWNTKVDQWAKDWWLHCQQTHAQPFNGEFTESWRVSLGTVILTHWDRAQIIEHCTKDNTLHYWTNK